MTVDRTEQIHDFLNCNGLNEAKRQAFAAHWSPRRYARLIKPDGGSLILMDADPDQKTAEFITLAKLLRDGGVNAPEIFAADAGQGLVLMQDFGTRNVGALIDAGGDPLIYGKRAVDLLIRMHQHYDHAKALAALPAMPVFNIDLFTQQVGLFLDTYAPSILQRAVTPAEREDFTAAWQTALQPIASLPQTLMLRDYMFDNLMELPQGLGVLDFQDAGYGPAIYDIASIAEQVRRDLDPDLAPQLIDYYAGQTGQPAAQAQTAATILAAQRHMRILGILTKHADKAAFIPRVKNHLLKLWQDPTLAPVSAWSKSMRLNV